MEGASERGSPDEGMDTEGRLTRERTRRPREVAQSPALNADLALRRHKPRAHDVFTRASKLLGQRAESDNLRKDNPYRLGSR